MASLALPARPSAAFFALSAIPMRMTPFVFVAPVSNRGRQSTSSTIRHADARRTAIRHVDEACAHTWSLPMILRSTLVIRAPFPPRGLAPRMFTKTERARLRDDLVEAAHADEEIVGAALVGSAAAGLEDAWSDIDLVLQVSDDAVTDDVISRWTRRLYDRHGAAHHLDVTAGGVLYRVFFLDSALPVDL